MAKQIIILTTNPRDGGRIQIAAVYWFAVPLNRRIPAPNASSQYASASGAEISALQDGSVLEEVRNMELPSSYTTGQIKTALEKDYADRAAYLAAQPFKLQYAGVSWDGANWSA